MSNVAIPRGFNRPTVPWKSFLKLRFRLWPFSILNVMEAFPSFYNHGERKFFFASKKTRKLRLGLPSFAMLALADRKTC